MNWCEIINAVDGPFGLAALFVLAVLSLVVYNSRQTTAIQKNSMEAHKAVSKDFKESTDRMISITADVKVEVAKFGEKMDRNTDVLLGLHKVIDKTNGS